MQELTFASILHSRLSASLKIILIIGFLNFLFTRLSEFFLKKENRS